MANDEATVKETRDGAPDRLPPILCKPWCVEGTGHVRDGNFPADQACYSPELPVPLTPVQWIYNSHTRKTDNRTGCQLEVSVVEEDHQRGVVVVDVGLDGGRICRLSPSDALRLSTLLAALVRMVELGEAVPGWD